MSYTIKDSGERRQFDSGAVRDVQEGKGRCDLLPLDVVADYFDDNCVLRIINQYIRDGETKLLTNCLYSFALEEDINEHTMFLEVSKHYEQGCLKYGDRNWERGIPLHCYIDSAVRHYLKLLRGDTDENHSNAFVWNILGAIWTHKHMPELIDLPFRDEVRND